MTPRFPTRTLVLMLLALAAFLSMWWRTHQPRGTSSGPFRSAPLSP